MQQCNYCKKKQEKQHLRANAIKAQQAKQARALADPQTNDEITREVRGASVYLIGSSEMEPIKIGKARSIQARVRELQTGCPYRLECLFSLPFKSEADAYNFESALHASLSSLRLEGEWFSVSLERAIELMKSKDPYRRF